MGLGSLVASCAMAIPLGHFFRAPQLPLVVVVMSTTFVINSFKTVPLALLQRDLRFKALALVEMSQAVVLAMSMMALALAGFRYWTLVFGAVLGALISTAAILRLRLPPVAWPRRTSLKQAMTLSAHVLTSRLCWYAYSNADFLVAGRILGQKLRPVGMQVKAERAHGPRDPDRQRRERDQSRVHSRYRLAGGVRRYLDRA